MGIRSCSIMPNTSSPTPRSWMTSMRHSAAVGPIPTPAACRCLPGVEFAGQVTNSYIDQVGTEGVDFHDTRTAPHSADTVYRTQDPVRMQHSLDQPRSQYDPSSSIL